MHFPLVVSFYTRGTLYQLEVQNLIDSCKKFNIEYDIEGIDSFGTWELNCAYKPYFLFSKLQKYRRPLLWVDADAIFVQKPQILDVFQGDLSAYMAPELTDDHRSKVRSGTVYVNATDKGAGLVRAWALECQKEMTNPERTVEFWDQMALARIIAREKGSADIRCLPLEYVKIFDHPEDARKVLNPVIAHHQASRRSKNLL
ncbi:MAG: hypothetical protein JSR58_06420 [Verrucomicrobia bacterium]|nr:hypothetical protein [Verrucomicrobiota bacterium]